MNAPILLDADTVRRRLLLWGRENIKRYPWRFTDDPYRVLVSEIMLQRTRADQVVPIYSRFLQFYPEVQALAQADEGELKELLRPLGLGWRVEKLRAAAVKIVQEHGGIVPRTKKELLSLPGVGQYIAGAILCFAYGMPEVLVDTNTVRITGRLFGLSVTESSRRSPEFRRLLELLLDRNDPRTFNYALLDFGSDVCRARRPICTGCPLSDLCSFRLRHSGGVRYAGTPDL
jgi:A/G-specific adenine glycosylase